MHCFPNDFIEWKPAHVQSERASAASNTEQAKKKAVIKDVECLSEKIGLLSNEMYTYHDFFRCFIPDRKVS